MAERNIAMVLIGVLAVVGILMCAAALYIAWKMAYG